MPSGGIRSRTPGRTPFDTACDNIRKVADRVYANRLSRRAGCVELVLRFQRMVAREEHSPDYNPYEAFARALRTNFPEVWAGDQHNSAAKALKPWVK